MAIEKGKIPKHEPQTQISGNWENVGSPFALQSKTTKEGRSEKGDFAVRLRRRAEAMARDSLSLAQEDREMPSPEGMDRTLHELMLHQIELEMQADELRRISDDLFAERARYFELYDLAPVGYCTVSAGGLIQDANLTAATLLGTDRSSLVKHNFFELIHKDHQDIYYLQRKKLYRTGEPFDCDLQMVKKDGRLFWAHLATTAGWNSSAGLGQAAHQARVSRVVLIDISERKRMEEENAKIQNRNIETLGVLAGGIAHDFNNLLASILGNANVGALKLEKGQDPTIQFQAIETAAIRAADLTQRLMAYAGKINPITKVMDLNTTVKEIIIYFTGSIAQNVTINYEQSDRLPFILGDSGQIFQVIQNLVSNAVESFVEGVGGLIRIRTQAECFDPVLLKSGHWVLPIGPGHYATVEVTDSGPGMPPENLSRAFEPFFTTKFIGRGLGLAAVLGILRSHGGGLRVQSIQGQGSSFKIFLPAMQGPRSSQSVENLTVWRGEGRLLVVDANQEERTKVRQWAEGMGFSVMEAPGYREGVGMLRSHMEEVALVVLGLSKSRQLGSKTFGELRKISAGLSVILGIETELQDSEGKFEGMSGLLKKPYRMAEFQGLLQRVLGK